MNKEFIRDNFSEDAKFTQDIRDELSILKANNATFNKQITGL